MRAVYGFLGWLVLAGVWAPAPAAETFHETADAVLEPVTTRHAVTIDGVRVPYLATFEQHVLTHEGKPQATISAISYVRADVTERDARAVVFFFNGGPGASSSPLHFGALGPRLRERGADGSRRIVENPDSIVDVADLVYVDPVGTGFSRGLPGGDPQRYWSNTGDAAAMLELIRAWLARHERESSPLLIVGQSYGGYRLARMMEHAGDLNLAALVLISPALENFGASSDLEHVFDLPTMAAAAWYHERVERSGQSVAQWFDAAAEFARTDYLVGLFQGSALPAPERERLAARISAFIGLPAEFVLDENLRVGSEKFLNTLLADRKLLVGRLDVRVTGPFPEDPPPDRPAAANDPALGLGRSNVIPAPDIAAYLVEELGVATDREYLSLTLDVNFKWDRSDPQSQPGAPGPSRHIAAVMRDKPHLTLVLMSGLYDLAVPTLAPLYSLRHADIPLERLRVARFEAGHSPYEGSDGRAQMSRLFRDLLRNIAAL
jgi:carboxypeptidase C (cathepsin A)